MADQTPTGTAGDTARGGPMTDHATASAELAPVMKVTRAKATTSGVPGRPPAAKTDSARASGKPAKANAAVTAEPRSVIAPDKPGRPPNVDVYQGGADSVAADAVSITQGGASVVSARKVEIHQGGIANARADDISVRIGGVALARADRLSVEMGGVGLALAREAQVTQGMARTVIAQDVRIDQGLVGTAFAGRVTFEQPAGVFLLLAGRTEGPVKALMDWRGALAFGAAFGLLVGLLRRR